MNSPVKKQAKQSGFTLIEIVIVLAIAALILVIVFLAVQGAQRSQRDNAAKNAAARTLSQIEQFAGNNGGRYPKSTDDLATYFVGISPTPKFGTGDAKKETIIYAGTATCDADKKLIVTTGATDKQTAVAYFSEAAGGSVCISN